jgi:hypothetical protein
VTNKDQLPFVLYGIENDEVRLRVLMRNETIWLTLNQMAELFDVNKSSISRHLKNIFETSELLETSTVAKIETVQLEGNRSIQRELEFYNLDAIIAVGYRVNSKRATQFRIWATNILKEFIKKGFVLDDDRLKQGERVFEQDYFRELLERVGSIRASERRIYQQITDIFAECSVDYNARSETTHNFYATIQNKFHFAITGNTAAEIVYDKSDGASEHMGLSTWKNAPDGRILASDATIAKNYLTEKEIKRLERTISGFFDYVENIIENEISLTMQDMADSVNKFLTFNNYKILDGKGSISKETADKKALEEYKVFNKTQKIKSDFDKLLKSTQDNEKKNKKQ